MVLSFFNKLKLKTDIFRNMYNSIMNTLVVPTDFCEDPKILKALLPPVIDNDRENLLAFLKAIDTGITDIGYAENERHIDRRNLTAFVECVQLRVLFSIFMYEQLLKMMVLCLLMS